ncbi:MAG: PQQ-dependent sugar dehydrogenase [Marinobacter sp.]
MTALSTRACSSGSLALPAPVIPKPYPFVVLFFLVLSLCTAAAVRADDRSGDETVRSASAGELKTEELATLEFPWGVALLPDGRLLITEKPGHLRIFDGEELSDPLEGVPEVVYRGQGDQGGLLDVALDPDFDSNQRIYLSYVEAAEQQPSGTRDMRDVRFGDYLDISDDILRGGAVARARLDGDKLTDLEVIWRQEPKTIGRGHFGHRLTFGPDGKLFVTSGDRMRFEPAQHHDSNLGKVIRINRDGSIPRDNPFAGEDDKLGEIWSYGHRNILAAVMHPESDQLLTFEMGPLGGDEVNLIESGENYGWPVVSNGAHYNRDTIPPHSGTDEYRKPIRTWTPVISPSGAMEYTGDRFSGWQGSVLVGGLSGKTIVRLEMDGERIAVEERIDMKRRIRDLIQAPDGSVYVLVDDREGVLLRLSP